jgi:hypothetical protein
MMFWRAACRSLERRSRRGSWKCDDNNTEREMVPDRPFRQAGRPASDRIDYDGAQPDGALKNRSESDCESSGLSLFVYHRIAVSNAAV